MLFAIEGAQRFLVKKGDFLVSRGNGSLSLVGRGGLIEVEPDEVAYPDTLIRVRVNQEKINPNFLSWLWESRLIRSQIEGVARTTAGIYKINQKSMQMISLPLPSVEEQNKIVTEIDAVINSFSKLEPLVISEHLEKLDQSILAKAFRGQLVPQDPTDEPDSILLERIRSEREKMQKKGKEKKKGRKGKGGKGKGKAATTY
ncbi:MAG: restriction endonuclease subunit S [Cyanobacteria bacterium P01_A01_bin.116]